MSSKRKSFLLHIDSLDILDDLSNDQAGMLFKAIKSFQHGESIELESVVKIAFSPFKNQFIRDNEKYVKTCEARAKAGAIGGRVTTREQGIDNDGLLQFYVLRLFNEDEDFIKIGITTNKINRRFSGNKNMPYEYEVLEQIIDIEPSLESSIQEGLSEFLYEPHIKFPGHLECYDKKSLEKLYKLQAFAQAKQSKTKQNKANLADSDSKSDSDSDSDSKKDSESVSKRTVKRFAPPSVQEVFSYMAERGFADQSESEKFFDYYTSNGWQVGKNKMKCWKAAVRNWLKNKKPASNNHSLQNQNYRSGSF
jgi:hypothetical protein